MSSKSSGFRVKRSLSFGSKEPLPYAGKTFYVDVKSSSLKSKISQRVLNLGGQIENFLSKDLSLLVTDKQENDHLPQTTALKHSKTIPLSRGQALLLKASGQSSTSAGNNSHGLVQSAIKLGIEIQTPTVFLQSSSKLLSKVKKLAQKLKQDDPLCGMSLISWEDDKENMSVIKVEDEDGIFRPLFKQFEKFPQICYSECGSPFDVGVVLTKQNENNQSKKTTVSGRAQLGGYCESCDHWYKCSLREHLASSKHKKFIAETENFTSLNQVTSNLPDFERFVGKHGLKGDNILSQNEILPICSKTNNARSELNNTTTVDVTVPNKTVKSKCGSSLMSRINDCKILDCNQQAEKDVPKHLVVNSKNESDSFSDRIELSKPSSHLRSSQRFSIHDVLKSITDHPDVDYHEETNHVDTLNSFHGNIEVPSHFSDPKVTDIHKDTIPDSSKANVNVSGPSTNIVSDKQTGSTMKIKPHPSFTADANFSSSSFSFGDTGVGNVLTILNNENNSYKSQHSGLSNSSTRHSDNRFNKSDTARFDNASHKSQPLTSSGQSNSSTQNGETFNISDSASGFDMPIVDNVKSGNFVENFKQSVDVECISVATSCAKHVLQEDINIGRSQETTSGLNDELPVPDKKSAPEYQFPEYSNITEESNQSKLLNNDKTTPTINQMRSLDFHCLNFDTDLFGNDTKSVTPSKEHMESLREQIHKKKANTGSTIRNWLVPMDDNGAVDSPAGLDRTLVDASLNGANIEPHFDKDIVVDVSGGVKDIEETTDTSKVAAWIQNNIFDSEIGNDAEKCGGTNAIAQTCAETLDKFDENVQTIDDIEMDESCSVRKYNTGLSIDNNSNSAWSESGTSISDCTLPNFRCNSIREAASKAPVCEEDQGNHLAESVKPVLTDSDNASVKSSLSSSVTARGIKITGLSLIKNDPHQSVDTIQVCDNTTTVGVKDTGLNSLNQVPQQVGHQILPHHNLTYQKLLNTAKSMDKLGVNNDVPVVQNLAQIIHRPVVPVPDNQVIPSNQPQKLAAKKNTKNTTKAKGRKTPANQSKRTKKGPVVKNPTPSQNLYGGGNSASEPYNALQRHPMSSVHVNTMLSNTINNQYYSITNEIQQPVMKQYGYHMNSPSASANSNRPSSHYPSMQACVGSVYSPFSNGTGMMDFLLSPGSQQSTNYRQPQVSQQQQQPQSYYSQSHHQGINCVQSQQNAHLYSQNTGSDGKNLQQAQFQHETATPHFLSQNSNFLAYGYQQPSPKPTLIPNVAQSSVFLSPGSSNQCAPLQTIDMSHIAESNSNDCTASFNIVKPRQTKTVETKGLSQNSVKPSPRQIINSIGKNTIDARTSIQYNSGNVASYGTRFSNMGTTSQITNTSAQPMTQIASVNTCVPGNQWTNSGMQYVSNQSLNPYPGNTNTIQTQNTTGYSMQHGYTQNQFVQAAHPSIYQNPQVVYNTVQTGDMKLTFRKMPASNTGTGPEQSKHDLMHYWNVRKAGDCRLVFSANVLGKRKAEETPTKSPFMNNSTEVDSPNCQEPLSKRRRCLIY